MNAVPSTGDDPRISQMSFLLLRSQDSYSTGSTGDSSDLCSHHYFPSPPSLGTSHSNPDEQLQSARQRPPLPEVHGTPFELIKQFFAVQEKRAALYGEFKDGFQKHLDGSMDRGKYAQLCTEITSKMSACSLTAIALEEQLLKIGKEQPAASIRVAQLGEKTKLNMTCTLQVLKKRKQENRWSWQQDGTGNGYIDASAMAELELREAGFASAAEPVPSVTRPSFANGNFRKKCDEHPDAATMCSCQEAQLANEPTQVDFEGAVSEATQQLEDAVRGINDALEELRYELAEEMDDE